MRATPPPPAARESERMRLWRAILVSVGIALLLIAAVALVNDVPPARYAGIGLWLVGALIVHDAIGAMLVFGVAVLLRRTGNRIPFRVIAMIEGALVIAVIVTVLFVPEAIKQGIGTANPSILPLDYWRNLGVFHVVLAALAASAAIVCAAIARRRPGIRWLSSRRMPRG